MTTAEQIKAKLERIKELETREIIHKERNRLNEIKYEITKDQEIKKDAIYHKTESERNRRYITYHNNEIQKLVNNERSKNYK